MTKPMCRSTRDALHRGHRDIWKTLKKLCCSKLENLALTSNYPIIDHLVELKDAKCPHIQSDSQPGYLNFWPNVSPNNQATESHDLVEMRRRNSSTVWVFIFNLTSRVNAHPTPKPSGSWFHYAVSGLVSLVTPTRNIFVHSAFTPVIKPIRICNFFKSSK